MRIIYKKSAIDDLLNTENYIINQFHNDQAAKKFKTNIVDTISLLKDNPYLGPKMSDRFNIDTSLRYLIVSKQIVFYDINEDNQVALVSKIIVTLLEYCYGSLSSFLEQLYKYSLLFLQMAKVFHLNTFRLFQSSCKNLC